MSARWADPFLLHLVALFPALLLAALLLWQRRRRQVAAALGDPALVARLAGARLDAFPLRRAALLLPAGALLGIAAAGPRVGAPPPAAPGGGDVVLVLDASNSMLAEDVAPSRLERQRALARALADALGGSRVGVVAYGGTATVLAPLTTDAAALHLYLDALDPRMVNPAGTSLASALRRGAALLEGPGALVLVGDGEALEPPEVTAAALAEVARRGIPVHTVAIGTAEGARVPDLDPATGERRGWKREPDGAEAVSRLDDAALREIASRTGGTHRADPGPGGAPALAAAASSAGAGFDGAGNRYRWPLALAIALVALDAVAGRRRSAA